MRLILATEFRKRYFDPKRPPDLRTIKRWVRSGVVAGRIIEHGKRIHVYIDTDAWERGSMTGNHLADKILSAA